MGGSLFGQGKNMSFMAHFKELRKVFIVGAYAVAVGSVLGWFLSDMAYAYLARPVTSLNKVAFITTTPMEPVIVKLKVSIVVGLVLALPVIFWQLWSFILPALNKKERKYLFAFVPSSVLLFLAGAAFCFYLVIPVGIKFLLFAGGGVKSTPFVTKTSYLNFILTFLLTFGLVFELPVILNILIRLQLLSPKTLAKKRRWAIFAIIVVAALVSPTPDLFSQALMALPMYLLYEISIWIGYLVVRKRNRITVSVVEQ